MDKELIEAIKELQSLLEQKKIIEKKIEELKNEIQDMTIKGEK